MGKNSLIVTLLGRGMVGDRGWRRLEAAQVLFKVCYVIGIFRGLEIMGDGVEVDAVLRQERLVLAEAVYQVPFVRLLLPAPGRLGRDNAAVDVGLDTVRAWLLLVAPDFTLLTQDA